MGTIFSKVEAKSAGIAIATPSIFNDEIWKKSPISLNSLSSQSTIAKTYYACRYLGRYGCWAPYTMRVYCISKGISGSGLSNGFSDE